MVMTRMVVVSHTIDLPARGLKNGVKRGLISDLRVELDDGVVVVGARDDLEEGVHVALVGLEQHVHALDLRPKAPRRDLASLDKLGLLARQEVARAATVRFGDGRLEGERLPLRVEDGDRVGMLRRLDDRVEVLLTAVLGLGWGRGEGWSQALRLAVVVRSAKRAVEPVPGRDVRSMKTSSARTTLWDGGRDGW